MRVASADTFDILVATDCRLRAGTTASVVDEIRAQARAGYRTGLLHVPSPLTAERSFAPALRDVVDDGTAILVTGMAGVTTKLLIMRHPSAFGGLPSDLPKISADRVVIVANDVPERARNRERVNDLPRVAEHLEQAAGVPPTWAPISPIVRDALTPLVAGQAMLPWDWEPVLDVAAWRVERDGFVADRPVLGRHTADHWTKWPGRRRDILAAYPDDPRYDVRVLGGIATPTAVLGYQPANWTGLAFGAMSPSHFLTGLDFFVYFHHRKFTEPIGRAVLEAIAAGAVAIVPRNLEPIFGDACRYGDPADVRGHVDELYADWDAFAAQSRAGVELAAKRFALETHLERLAGLIGQPTAPAPEAAPVTRPRGTLVVDLTRGDSVDSVVSSTVRATVADGAPRVVALPASRAADLTARVAVETFPRAADEMPAAERRHFLRGKLAGIVRAHSPARTIVVDDGHGAARELFADLHGVVPQLWLVHPDGGSGELDDAIAAEVAAILPPGWAIGPLPPGRPHAAAQSSGPVGTGAVARTLRRFRRWTSKLNAALRRKLLGWLLSDARHHGLMLVEVDDADHPLPVGGSADERVPVALVVVTDRYTEPVDGVRVIMERQVVAGTFRTALLAPPEWEPAAASAGLTVETFIPEQAWTMLYGPGWPPYFRQRVHEACQAVAASTVVFADHVTSEDAPPALDALEAARLRPPTVP